MWAIQEMNRLTATATWPAQLGGGPIAEPAGVTVSGDLIDDGYGSGDEVNGCNQWSNFTSLYGLDGTDGMLKYRVYEGRGNHDGGNTSNAVPKDCQGALQPSQNVAARNKVRAATPAFNITGTSATGLHYSWDWPLTDTCKLHFVHLNLFPGHTCGSPGGSPGREGPNTTGFHCATGGWTWPEDSLGFLETDLAAHASSPGTLVVAIQHYGYDGWSLTWFNPDQAAEMFATLNKYNTLVVLVGHTHGAGVYSYNGTHQGAWEESTPGYIAVVNAPATQKEDGQHNPLPSEFMVLDASLTSSSSGGSDGGQQQQGGVLRVAQRVGSAWGSVLGNRTFTC